MFVYKFESQSNVWFWLMVFGLILLLTGCTQKSEEANISTLPTTTTLMGEASPVSLTNPTETANSFSTPELATLESQTVVEDAPDETPTQSATTPTNSTATVDEPMSLPEEINISNLLFRFGGTYGFLYGYNDLSVRFSTGIATGYLIDSEMVEIKGETIGYPGVLAFADFSNQIAFWAHNLDGQPGFWLSDINLTNPKQIFIDDTGLFAPEDFAQSPVQIEWFRSEEHTSELQSH